jgi:uncharacterized protein with HEPN domain
MQRDTATLADMVNACEALLRMKPAQGFAQLVENEVLRFAILHQLMILGEASKRLSQGFKDANPNIPWREIAGMRDKLIHQYDGVDLMEVAITMEQDIPGLLNKLRLLKSI